MANSPYAPEPHAPEYWDTDLEPSDDLVFEPDYEAMLEAGNDIDTFELRWERNQ